ncbi:hypothetical protein ACFX2I_044528 [Malus domestica]
MRNAGSDEYAGDGEIQEQQKQRWYSSSASKLVLPQLCLNHVSFVCKSVSKSVRFYEDVLGFVLIQRPSSFKFEGAWLFNHGVGIHLLESDTINASEKKCRKINPKDNHISFQCSDMAVVVQKLEEMKIEYVTAQVEEGGVTVDQLFFHDPDGYMLEICNCHNLPVLPISSSCPLNLITNTNPNHASSSSSLSSSSSSSSSFYGKRRSEKPCSGEAATLMMESLVMDVMNISM